MRWIDGHLDLAYLAVCGRNLRTNVIESDIGCITLPALRDAHVEIAFATIFTEPGKTGENRGFAYDSNDFAAAEAVGLRQLAIYEQLQKQGELSIIRTAEDLHAASANPKVVLLMEGADPIRSPAHVPFWRERGLSIVGLTWADGTRYAGGNSMGGPLTRTGIELIAALDEAGIVHDASHLSDEAFDGLLAVARGRIIASHSNCRMLLEPKQRHLRDDQIKAIADRQGIVGLNLYSRFLAVGRRATIADCVAHVQHVAEIMGHRRGVALGSDMDGGFAPSELPLELDHPTKLSALADALRDAGWSDDELHGFAYENWRRFLGEVLR